MTQPGLEEEEEENVVSMAMGECYANSQMGNNYITNIWIRVVSSQLAPSPSFRHINYHRILARLSISFYKYIYVVNIGKYGHTLDSSHLSKCSNLVQLFNLCHETSFH